MLSDRAVAITPDPFHKDRITASRKTGCGFVSALTATVGEAILFKRAGAANKYVAVLSNVVVGHERRWHLKPQQIKTREAGMIADEFTQEVLLEMAIALDRACESISDHESRKYVAQHIIEQGRRGDATLGTLTYVARKASVQVASRKAA